MAFKIAKSGGSVAAESVFSVVAGIFKSSWLFRELCLVFPPGVSTGGSYCECVASCQLVPGSAAAWQLPLCLSSSGSVAFSPSLQVLAQNERQEGFRSCQWKVSLWFGAAAMKPGTWKFMQTAAASRRALVNGFVHEPKDIFIVGSVAFSSLVEALDGFLFIGVFTLVEPERGPQPVNNRKKTEGTLTKWGRITNSFRDHSDLGI